MYTVLDVHFMSLYFKFINLKRSCTTLNRIKKLKRFFALFLVYVVYKIKFIFFNLICVKFITPYFKLYSNYSIVYACDDVIMCSNVEYKKSTQF